MKHKLILLLCSFVISLSGMAQAEKKTETFKVYGNCEMCKSNIEGALKKKDGVTSKRWDVKAKTLTVTYDPSKITIQQIGEKVAGVGYDNEYATASDAVYKNLHQCCQYKRPDKK